MSWVREVAIRAGELMIARQICFKDTSTPRQRFWIADSMILPWTLWSRLRRAHLKGHALGEGGSGLSGRDGEGGRGHDIRRRVHELPAETGRRGVELELARSFSQERYGLNRTVAHGEHLARVHTPGPLPRLARMTPAAMALADATAGAPAVDISRTWRRR